MLPSTYILYQRAVFLKECSDKKFWDVLNKRLADIREITKGDDKKVAKCVDFLHVVVK